MALSVSEDVLARHLSTINVAPLPHKDNRTDDEIVKSLCEPPPVFSEKNVWAFWDGGFAKMRPWSQRNVIGWVRQLGPKWTVRVLDRVENSPSNIFKFLDDSEVPECLADGSMNGRYSGQHASDMIRLPCVYKYGGAWMDVGIMLFMHLDQMCWDVLTDASSKFEVALASADPSLMSGLAENFFFAARKGNGFIRRWRDIFFEVWKGRSDCKGVHSHPLFNHLISNGHVARFLQMASEDKLDYFGAYLAYERLRLLEDPDDGFSGPSFCKNRVLLIEYREFASAAMRTHNDGRKQFEFLTTTCEPDLDGQAGRGAREFCDYMLSQTAMMKLYHWKEEELPTLANLWDDPKNAHADYAPGTFAAYLRHVSSNYTQQRKMSGVKFPLTREPILHEPLLDCDDE